MMTRMFGFGCCGCADAGSTSIKANDASTPRQIALLVCMSPVRSILKISVRTPHGASACACCACWKELVARRSGARLLDLLHDAGKVVRLWRLERRELLERLQVLHPQLLADGQHVPVVL